MRCKDRNIGFFPANLDDRLRQGKMTIRGYRCQKVRPTFVAPVDVRRDDTSSSSDQSRYLLHNTI